MRCEERAKLSNARLCIAKASGRKIQSDSSIEYLSMQAMRKSDFTHHGQELVTYQTISWEDGCSLGKMDAFSPIPAEFLTLSGARRATHATQKQEQTKTSSLPAHRLYT